MLLTICLSLVLPCFAWARGPACPSASIPTNDAIILIADYGEAPATVSNRIESLPFLTSGQTAAAWRLYSASFESEASHNSRIRFDRQSGNFLYDASFLAEKNLSYMLAVPLEHLSIRYSSQLADIAGPDFRPLKLFASDSTSVTNFSALASAAMLEELILTETPVMTLDFLKDMEHLGRIQLSGVPVHDPEPIRKVIARHPSDASPLYVSIDYTLIPDFSLPDTVTGPMRNVSVENNGKRLSIWFVRKAGWTNLLDKTLSGMCSQDD